MSNNEGIYELKEDKSAQGLKFFFISKGAKDIVKIIQYSFVEELNGRNVYNLGLGDYNLMEDTLVDNVNTNNGDVYKVLNTVLSTISIFFENHVNDILMVQGSDGRSEFVKMCKLACTKNCGGKCRNFNRRINIYRGYLNKNYEKLNIEYQFLGGLIHEDRIIFIEPYERYKIYNSIFISQKMSNFIT